MSTKFSVSISDSDRTELEAQALALGKSKTGHASDMLLDGLSRGGSSSKAVENLRHQLRATERALATERRKTAQRVSVDILGKATGPSWSAALLEDDELRDWWDELAEFVGFVGTTYGVAVGEGWWRSGLLLEELAAAAAWRRDLEATGGDAAADPLDKLSFLRWINEDLRAIAADPPKAVKNEATKTRGKPSQGWDAFVDGEVERQHGAVTKLRKGEEERGEAEAAGAVGVPPASVDMSLGLGLQHTPLRPGVPPVDVGEDGMSDLARSIEPKEDMFARMQAEHDARKTPKRDRPGVDHAAIEAADRAAIEAEAGGLDPEEREYLRRRARNLAEEAAQETSPGAAEDGIEAGRRAQGEEA